MIPLKTKLFLILVFTSLNLFSQNFYDFENSFRFGEYLYGSNQYDLAVREFERCVFLRHDDQKSYLFLFKIYRKSNAFDKAIDSYSRFSGNLNFWEMNREFGSEYFKLLVQNNKYQEAGDFLNSNSSFKENADLKLSTILLKKEWHEAGNFLEGKNSEINKSLVEITGQGFALNKKSPFLAAVLSAIIPGSGKAYAGKWKDGLISFLMTSSAAFVSVQGFNKNSKSAYPWIMGSLALVYYSGNIYGSAQTALKYNKNKEDELVSKTRDFILRDY
jgi:tetratricopeptide (TPR) repeat protein